MFDTMYDMVSYAKQYMAASISKHHLEPVGNPGEVVWLKCKSCTIRLSNIENDYVRFEFWEPANDAAVFEFSDYLDCAYEMRSGELRPMPPKSLSAEEQFVATLCLYDRLMCDGYFDAPLAGDFSWAPAYHAMLAEIKRLSVERYKLGKAGHPEADAILDKKIAGDLTWMDDVRRILAEQEAKE